VRIPRRRRELRPDLGSTTPPQWSVGPRTDHAPRNIDLAEAFRQIDADGDGRLSVDELVQAIRAHHLGDIDMPLLGR